MHFAIHFYSRASSLCMYDRHAGLIMSMIWIGVRCKVVMRGEDEERMRNTVVDHALMIEEFWATHCGPRLQVVGQGECPRFSWFSCR